MIDLEALDRAPRRRHPRLGGRGGRRARVHPQRGVAAGEAAGAADRGTAPRAGRSRRHAHRARAPPRRRRAGGCCATSSRSRPTCTARPSRWSATCDWRRSPPRCAAWSRRSSATCCAPTPTSAITLVEREPWDTVALVADGRLEVGLVHTWGDVALELPEHLVRTSVAADVADVIVHRDHPLAGRDVLTPHDLVDEGWVATPGGHDLPPVAEPDVRRHRPPPPDRARVRWSSSRTSPLVGAGLGIALVPRLGRGAARRRPGRRTRLRPGADPRRGRRAPAHDGRLARRRGRGRGPLVSRHRGRRRERARRGPRLSTAPHCGRRPRTECRLDTTRRRWDSLGHASPHPRRGQQAEPSGLRSITTTNGRSPPCCGPF